MSDSPKRPYKITTGATSPRSGPQWSPRETSVQPPPPKPKLGPSAPRWPGKKAK